MAAMAANRARAARLPRLWSGGRGGASRAAVRAELPWETAGLLRKKAKRWSLRFPACVFPPSPLCLEAKARGVHGEEHCLHVEGGDPALVRTQNSGVLCPVLSSLGQEGHGAPGAGPVSGNEGDWSTSLGRKVQPGEETSLMGSHLFTFPQP